MSAAANPALANDLIQKVTEEPEKKAPYEPKLAAPSDTTVMLPGGYITDTGDIIRTAEVRELNGLDEEAIARTSNLGKAVVTIIQRGTVAIGDLKADDKVLDELLAGDRDVLLLAIFKATFGPVAEVQSYCSGCQDFKTISVNIDEDIKIKALVDPVSDRTFNVQGKIGEITVRLPNGAAQRELIANAEKNAAELKTLLLEHCVTHINGDPVYSKLQVQKLGFADRNKINDEINKRVPGPQFEDTAVECPECGSEVPVPINLGTLFRF